MWSNSVNRKFRILWVLIIVAVCVACDQGVKALAKERLTASPPISLLYGIVRLEYTENPGAILGLGGELPSLARVLFMLVFSGMIFAATLVLSLNPHYTAIQIFGMALVSAGGIGNFIDRVINNGAVVDFASLGIGPLRTAILNLADIAIFVGAFVFLLFSRKKPEASSEPVIPDQENLPPV